MGQSDGRVALLARARGYALFLGKGAEATLSLRASPAEAAHGTAAVLRLRFAGADASVDAIGEAELPGKVNYFVGADPSAWRRAICYVCARA